VPVKCKVINTMPVTPVVFNPLDCITGSFIHTVYVIYCNLSSIIQPNMAYHCLLF
jgi:hypothetical protein